MAMRPRAITRTPDAGRAATRYRTVGVYLWSRRQVGRFFRVFMAVFTGFWLGALTRAQLEAVDDEYYVGTGERFDPIEYSNTAYNKSGLIAWEQKAIQTHFPIGGSLVVMGAGGGREVFALRRMSFEVDGWECQPQLVEAANRLLVSEGFEPTVTYVPRDAVPTDTKRYGGLIIGWGTYTLIEGRRRRIAVLRALRSKVDAGAPLLISFYARRAGDRRYLITAAVGNAIRRLIGGRRLEVGDYLDPNFVHLFHEQEIADELAAGGFVMEAFAARPYGHAVARAANLTPSGPPADGATAV
jgi:hypothetical protein